MSRQMRDLYTGKIKGMEVLKTTGNTVAGGVVTFINATVTMTSINEGLAIVVGILTCVYLVCQIRKAIKKK